MFHQQEELDLSYGLLVCEPISCSGEAEHAQEGWGEFLTASGGCMPLLLA